MPSSVTAIYVPELAQHQPRPRPDAALHPGSKMMDCTGWHKRIDSKAIRSRTPVTLLNNSPDRLTLENGNLVMRQTVRPAVG